ncbi:MAG: Rieske 2Fe-2S domain-containing protein [Acidimicrobiia bacterium]|nr:Rieske 2Fe-2S domain-containing protein [Acidimicrobiia bacterium]
MVDGTVASDTSGHERWLDVGDVVAVTKRRKFVVADGEATIVIVAHDGGVFAMDNICIHRQRELVKGVVLRDRLVCPGHQWAFELGTGWEAVKEECQPTYAVRVTDTGRVEVDLASRTTSRSVAAVAERDET